MHHQILPIPCKPWTLTWLPERLAPGTREEVAP
jgi:hypothetical protein